MPFRIPESHGKALIASGAHALSSRRVGEEPTAGLASGDHRRVAHGLERRDGLGDESGLLFDDSVIDGGAEALVEDFDAEQLGAGGGSVLIGAGDGDVEGQAPELLGGPRGLLLTV